MAKKRKNTASATTKQQGDNNNQKGKSSTDNKTNNKKKFHGFPLDLVSNKSWSKKFNNNNHDKLKLKELHPGFVWVVPNFFTAEECLSWISYCESCHDGFEYTQHPATKFIAQRECFRMQQSNAVELTTILYHRLEMSGILSQLHQVLAPCNFPPGYNPIGFNPNLRLYKYTKGHSFGKHVDGSNLVESMGMTEITVLVYLSSCRGGATRFYPIPTSSSSCRRKQQSSSSFAFDPEPGTMLLHVHGDRCLEHEADPVVDGIKYVLRTDVVFNNNHS